MTNPVTLNHVRARYPGVLTSTQEINATAWLSDAWAHVLRHRPNLEADLVAATVSEADVIRVVSEMVVRKLLNPERKSMESIDDYRFEREKGTGDLYATEEELGDLVPVVDNSGAGTRNSVRLVAYGES